MVIVFKLIKWLDANKFVPIIVVGWDEYFGARIVVPRDGSIIDAEMLLSGEFTGNGHKGKIVMNALPVFPKGSVGIGVVYYG